MIQKIIINNFQSHKYSELKLEKGVNIVMGSSNSGKTAILRALYWLVYNRPAGDAFVSHWNADKENWTTSIQIWNEKDSITRRKDKNLNCYINNEESFKALRSDVPEEIQKTLNITDVNIQKQMDAPFLVSNTAGEVARFFNRIIKLNKIDTMLSEIENRRRKTNNKIKTIEIEIQDMENKIKNYTWIPTAERLIARYQKIQKQKDENYTLLYKIEKELQEYNNYIEILEDLDNLEKAEKTFKQIEKIFMEKENKQLEIIKLDYYLKALKEEEGTIKKYNLKYDEIENLLVDIEDFQNKKNKNEQYIEHIGLSIKTCIDNEKIIKNNEQEVTLLLKRLPKICPTCSQPVKEWWNWRLKNG